MVGFFYKFFKQGKINCFKNKYLYMNLDCKGIKKGTPF
jgi:hypothetical protein